MIKRTFQSIIYLILVCLLNCCNGPSNAPIPHYSFTPKESKIIALLGDTQRTLWDEFGRAQNDSIRNCIFPEIASKKPAAVVILGDLTAWGASESQWNYFDSITAPIRKELIPIFPVLGNHDYFGSNEKAMKNAISRFNILKEHTWYNFDLNSIGFVILNSNLGDLNKKDRQAQTLFLDSILNYYQINNNIKAIVVCWHHAVFSNSEVVKDNKDVENEFVGILKKYPKVKLIASGHAHTYEHFKYFDKHFLVSGGGGGPRQNILPLNKSNHKDLFTTDSLRGFHYCLLELIDDKITVKMNGYDANSKTWKLYDSWIAD